MKRTVFLLALSAAVLSACSNHEDGSNDSIPEISGHVAQINSYGQIVTSFTPQEMKEKGFEYADLIHAKIGDDIDINSIPFLTSFNECGIFEPTYVDYNALGTDYGFGLLGGDFHAYLGGKEGDKVTITLTQKGGYKELYELLKSTYPVERRPGETAEQYANFRMITTTGMGAGILYRSSNPLNCAKNEGRYSVVDSLARETGIQAEIDLADTPEAIEKYMGTANYASTYCPQLFKEGNTIACGLSANCFGDGFKAKMGEVVKFMIARKAPFLIHCNEGKDRCGFVSMLFEAFMGADVSELRNDYMETMLNFYHIEKGGKSYQLREEMSIDRMIWLLCHEDALQDFKNIDWEKIDVTSIGKEELQEAAQKYFKECGVSDEACKQLRAILSAAAH